ncbi:hypothetical protein [Glaesserella sp.]|uniref:hypothetical protein n=1 Tax=Glaesserella sp. TaxID=2094731 RepID=UPI0035A09A3B
MTKPFCPQNLSVFIANDDAYIWAVTIKIDQFRPPYVIAFLYGVDCFIIHAFEQPQHQQAVGFS